jgi:AcrR family transcriptional regulator
MTTDRYHHGDLPNALRRAAVDVIGERGVAGFSLREVARRAGVSHTAPAHHFGDVRGLLTPTDQLARLGRAYVEVSRSHPGHCAVVFAQDAVDCDASIYQQSGQRAYGVLRGVVERLAAADNPDLDVELAAASCWAMVQGLLTIHGPLTRMAADDPRMAVPDIGDLAEAMSRLIIEGLAPTRVEVAPRRRSPGS